MKIHLVALLAYTLVCCRSGSAAGTERFVTDYATALQANEKRDPLARMRSFAKAAGVEESVSDTCTNWNCTATAISVARRTALFEYAAYHLADSALKQGYPKESLAIISLVGAGEPGILRKASLLKGKVLQMLQDRSTADHFRAHAAKYPDAESLYVAAAALDIAGDKKMALELALKVLEKPEADFAFAQSGLIVRNLLGQKLLSYEDQTTKIRLMEALRVAKDRPSAQKLFADLAQQKLDSASSALFAHYGARLMVDKADVRFITERFLALDAGNEKVTLDVCERLLKKKLYSTVEKLFRSQDSKGHMQCRLRLAQRTSKYTVESRALAADYISKFDPDSTLAERIFLRSCLNKSVDAACMESLRELTRGKSIGAGARYYLARFYAASGGADKALPILQEIAKDYADDFYFYRLLEKPTGLTAPPGSDKKMRALLMGSLNEAKDVNELSELRELYQRAAKAAQNLTGSKQTAFYLLSADSRDEMREVLRGEEKPQIYETLIALGIKANKSDISLYGVKQWLRENKLRPFLFEIPTGLRELLYPTTYAAHVRKYGAKHNIEVAEVMALIRQESQFFPAALSSARAQGLMQLLPGTAKLVAQKEKLAGYNLFSAEDNIRLGIAFMRDIKNNYAADFTGLAIAYNAGPGRFTQWKKKYNNDEDIFIEEIPFQETYHYVRILFVDRAKYRMLLN